MQATNTYKHKYTHKIKVRGMNTYIRDSQLAQLITGNKSLVDSFPIMLAFSFGI